MRAEWAQALKSPRYTSLVDVTQANGLKAEQKRSAFLKQH